MTAVFAFFLQHFLIRPDSPYGKFVQILLLTCLNPFSLEAALWLHNSRVKSLCLSPRDLMLKESHPILRLSWGQFITFFLPMTVLGKGIWTNSGHELWGSPLVKLLGNVLFFSFWILMCEVMIHRAAAALFTAVRGSSSRAEHGWKVFDTPPPRRGTYVPLLKLAAGVGGWGFWIL